jgi:hypothetical protein
MLSCLSKRRHQWSRFPCAMPQGVNQRRTGTHPDFPLTALLDFGHFEEESLANQ